MVSAPHLVNRAISLSAAELWECVGVCIEKTSGRLTVGAELTLFLLRAYSENNENYIEVPLIFDPVKREDLHTDFKCVVRNTMSFQTLRTTVKEGMDFGGLGCERERQVSGALWMWNKGADSAGGYLVSLWVFC